jgi:hypothetical protein
MGSNTSDAAAAGGAPLLKPSYAARRSQAKLWTAIIAATIACFATIAYSLPRPPPGMPWHWGLPGQTGIGLSGLARLLPLSAALAAALVATQELLLRPLLSHGAASEKELHLVSERIFFGSSIGLRLAFIAVLAHHHYSQHDAQAVGDTGHRAALISLFYAGYAAGGCLRA